MTEQGVGQGKMVQRGRLGISPSEAPLRLRQLALRVLPALARLHRIRDEVRRLDDPFAVADYALRELRVEVRLSVTSLDQIPRRGGVVITANHPFGGLDGLLAIAAIGRRRRDLRILANAELARIEELHPLIIPVDPFGGLEAARANMTGMRRALRWLADGGVLLVFPAGEVSRTWCSGMPMRAGSPAAIVWRAPMSSAAVSAAADSIPPRYSTTAISSSGCWVPRSSSGAPSCAWSTSAASAHSCCSGRLGGRVLGFNIDTGFANALDCLILVDLRKTDPKVLRRYMSDSAWARFQQRHCGRASRNGNGLLGGVG
jgi:hypothetical protein